MRRIVAFGAARKQRDNQAAGTLGLLSDGDLILVNMPGYGYVGVGMKQGETTVIDDLEVRVERADQVATAKELARLAYEKAGT